MSWPTTTGSLDRSREDRGVHVVTRLDEATGAILATNAYNVEFADRVAFAHVSDATRSATGDRGLFIGRNGTLSNPAGMQMPTLPARFGAGLDPCAALHVQVELAPGASHRLAALARPGPKPGACARADCASRERRCGRSALERVEADWDRTLQAIEVRTPDDSFDVLVNRWLLYQDVACRLWARCGYYQPGGAYGFRDQLQDVMALSLARPDLARAHLLRAAGRQFRRRRRPALVARAERARDCDPDVRTTCCGCRSSTAEYVAATGDRAVLDERIAFLEAPPLEPGEQEAVRAAVASTDDGHACSSTASARSTGV